MTPSKRIKFAGFEHDLPQVAPDKRPKGTGYVGFQPAESQRAAKKRRAGRGAASIPRVQQKFGGR